MTSAGWASLVCAVLLMLAAPVLPSAPEALDKQDRFVSYENNFPRVEWKASNTSSGGGALPRHRLLSKSSKKSYPSEEYEEEEVMKDFEDFYGPLVDMGEVMYKSNKKSKGEKRGSSSTEDMLSLEFSMVFSMGHDPKRSKSAKASRHSKKERGAYENDKTHGRASGAQPVLPDDSDTLRAIPHGWINASKEFVTHPPSAARVAETQANESSGEDRNQRVDLTIPPYMILYQVTDSVVPVPEQYTALTTMTSAFLQHRFKATPGINHLTAMKTELDTSFVSSSGTIVVRFHTVVSYRSIVAAPTSDILENRIRQAFAGSEQAEYISRLNELREDNAFSTTVAIAFNNLAGTGSRQGVDRQEDLTRQRTIAGAALGFLFLSLTTCSIIRQRRRTNADNTKKRSMVPDESICPATVAGTLVTNKSSCCDHSASSQKDSDSPRLTSLRDQSADSSSVYTSGQSYLEDDWTQDRSDASSFVAGSFDSLYISPPVRFALNSFERARRDDEVESLSNKPSHVVDASHGRAVQSSSYPWQSSISMIRKVSSKDEADSDGASLDLESSSCCLSLTQDVMHASKSVERLQGEHAMDNDDLSTIADTTRNNLNERQMRIEKAQNDGKVYPLANTGCCDKSQYLVPKAESHLSPARNLEHAPVSTINDQSASTIRSSGSSDSDVRKSHPANVGQKDFDHDTHTITKLPTYMERKGKAQEFIAPWSEAAKAQNPELQVGGHPGGMETVASCANSLGDKSTREKAYILARTMNRLHLDGREPWWRVDEKSMTRRNRLSFTRAHYSRYTEDQSDNESFTSGSDTVTNRLPVPAIP